MKLLCACTIWLVGFVCGVLKVNAQTIHAENAITSITTEELYSADTSRLFTIKEFLIEGNSYTKPAVIVRELPFKLEDQVTLSHLVALFAEAKKRLMNTGLFSSVVVSMDKMTQSEAYIKIEVRERWYIIPVPFVNTVDKTFGEWVKEQKMDMKRVNYGIQIRHNNITGRNDKLNLHLKNGFTKQLSVSYDGLVLDNRMRWTSNLGFTTGKNKEINYITDGNRRIAYKKSDEFVHTFNRSFIEFSYRKAIKTRHTFGYAYNKEHVADTVFDINPHFSRPYQSIRFHELYYNLSYFNVDFIPYPTKGYIAEVDFRRRGLNDPINLWQLTAKGSGTWPLSHRFFLNLRLGGMLKLPFNQPYINQQLLGSSGLFMQGYEYYVVDGVAGGYSKLTASKELLNTSLSIPSERLKRLNHIPIRVYGKIYGNAGYVYNPEPGRNRLNNKMLLSGGFGLDIIVFYDFIFKLEWSFNQLGQNGLYLHRKDYF